jgi:hypothetical protein
MFIEDLLRNVERLEEKFEHELRELLRLFPHHRYRRRHHHRRPIQVLITRFNNQNFIIMDPLSLQNGKQAPINEALVDADTLQPIPDAVKVNKSRVSDNPAAAVVDGAGNLVAVAPGTGNLTVVNTWTYIDQNTKESVTEDETTTSPFVVTATPEGVLQVVTLGQASAIPAAAVTAAN